MGDYVSCSDSIGHYPFNFLINWKIQIYKVIVQLNAILNRKTKKLVTVSLSDRRLEHLVEIINQIVSKDNIYLGEFKKRRMN